MKLQVRDQLYPAESPIHTTQAGHAWSEDNHATVES